ncbi:putative motility protein [bacterium]|nr:putative motility protein [bacterium]
MSSPIGNVASYSTEQKLREVQDKGSVSVFKKQLDQTEAVVGKLLSGIEATAPRAPEQSGQTLNTIA